MNAWWFDNEVEQHEYASLKAEIRRDGFTMKRLGEELSMSQERLRGILMDVAAKRAQPKIRAFKELEDLLPLHRLAQRKLQRLCRVPEGYLRGEW